MSFSSKVKEELEKAVPGSRHCQLAELAALIHFGCKINLDSFEPENIAIYTENPFVDRK